MSSGYCYIRSTSVKELSDLISMASIDTILPPKNVNLEEAVILETEDPGSAAPSIELLDLACQEQSYERDYKIREAIKNIRINNENVHSDIWKPHVAPFFAPKEIEELAGYYSDEVDPRANELFIEYTNAFYGYSTSFTEVGSKWYNFVNEYASKIELGVGNYNYNKQSLIRAGWNPEIPFNESNMEKAKLRLCSILKEMYQNFSIVDITPFYYEDTLSLSEAVKDKKYPISIVLIEGNGILSPIIKKATNSTFSHASLCIDNDLTKLYSFNADNKINKRGGFSIEDLTSLKDAAPDHKVSIFTFFVNEKQYKNIKKNIDHLTNHITDTTYSYLNILLMPFKNISVNLDSSMICSQFVDRILKLSNIDITGIDSSKVTPAYFYDITVTNSRIYKMYDGSVGKLNFKQFSKKVISFAKKHKSYNEAGALYEYCFGQTTYPILSEARNLFLNFDGEGNMLFTNPLIDYDQEYFSSHRALLEYEKVGNTDGIKYELAKLYYLNYRLEKEIYGNKILSNKEKNKVSRARILNDFNKYSAYIAAKDPSFNFNDYYAKSEFSPHTVKVDRRIFSNAKKFIGGIL